MPRRPFSDFMQDWERIARRATPEELALARIFTVHGATMRERWPGVQIGHVADPHATTIRALLEFRDLDRPLFDGQCLDCGAAIFPVALFSITDAGGVTSACTACGSLQLRMIDGPLGGQLVEIADSQAAHRGTRMRTQPFGPDGRVWQMPAPGTALRAVVGEIDEWARFGLATGAAAVATGPADGGDDGGGGGGATAGEASTAIGAMAAAARTLPPDTASALDAPSGATSPDLRDAARTEDDAEHAEDAWREELGILVPIGTVLVLMLSRWLTTQLLAWTR